MNLRIKDLLLVLGFGIVTFTITDCSSKSDEPNADGSSAVVVDDNVARSDDGTLTVYPSRAYSYNVLDHTIYVEGPEWWIEEVRVDGENFPVSEAGKQACREGEFKNVYGGSVLVDVIKPHAADGVVPGPTPCILLSKVGTGYTPENVQVVVASPTGQCVAEITVLSMSGNLGNDPLRPSQYDFLLAVNGEEKALAVVKDEWHLAALSLDGEDVVSFDAKNKGLCATVGEEVTYEWLTIRHEAGSVVFKADANIGSKRSFKASFMATDQPEYRSGYTVITGTQLGAE